MNNITLGVHLIVKDEAELLPNCLASLEGADEIVIVDTGSTDASIAIAQACGARVLQREWEHDFSAARNAGLSNAKTDWILILDADECLQTPLTKLKQILSETTAQAFTVSINSWLGTKPEDRVNHSVVRLFRNKQGYSFSGRIHEAVDSSIINKHGTSAISSSEIEITHFGYLPEIMNRKQKILRNEQLLQLTIAEHPEDPFHSYNLAVTYCQDGHLDEAQRLLLHTLNHASLQVSYRPAMVRDLCKIYLSTGNMKAIDSLLVHELERYNNYPDLHYIQGQSLESQGLLERAFLSYQHAESIPDQGLVNQKYVSETGVGTFRPLTRMGLISQQLGLHEDAARLYHRALQYHSLYAPALLGIASAFQHLAVPDEEIGVLLVQLVPPDSTASRFAILSTLYEVDAFETIAKLSRETFPFEPETISWITSALIITNRHQEAHAAIQEKASLFFHEKIDIECRTTLSMIWAICQWKLFGGLQEDLLTNTPEPLHFGLRYIDQCLQKQAIIPIDKEREILLEPLITDLIKQSVKLEQPIFGQTLVELLPEFKSTMAIALYKEGYLNAAGEHFITLVCDKQVTEKTLFYISEMMFDKGHYSEASKWFQQVLEQAPTDEAASIGLSLCYLQLAKHHMEDALKSLQEDHTQGPFQEDIGAIQRAISFLNRTPWHTQWSFRQSQRRQAQ